MNAKVQELIEDAAAHRDRLWKSIEGISEEEAQRPPAEGKWSIAEILDHLLKSETATMKLYQRKLAEAQQRQILPDNRPGSERGSLDHMREQFRQPGRAPDIVVPEAGKPLSQLRQSLEQSRQRLLGLIDSLSEYDLSQLTHPHPLLGELNLYQWILVGGQHELRHAKQIERIRGEVAAFS